MAEDTHFGSHAKHYHYNELDLHPATPLWWALGHAGFRNLLLSEFRKPMRINIDMEDTLKVPFAMLRHVFEYGYEINTDFKTEWGKDKLTLEYLLAWYKQLVGAQMPHSTDASIAKSFSETSEDKQRALVAKISLGSLATFAR